MVIIVSTKYERERPGEPQNWRILCRRMPLRMAEEQKKAKARMDGTPSMTENKFQTSVPLPFAHQPSDHSKLLSNFFRNTQFPLFPFFEF
jgi:hypothetical protein